MLSLLLLFPTNSYHLIYFFVVLLRKSLKCFVIDFVGTIVKRLERFLNKNFIELFLIKSFKTWVYKNFLRIVSIT